MLAEWAGDRYVLQSRVDSHGTPRLDIDFWLRSDEMKAVVEIRYVQSLEGGVKFDPEEMKMVVRVSRPGRQILVDETLMSVREVEAFLTRMDEGDEGFGEWKGEDMLADIAHDVEQMFLNQSDVVADLVRRQSRDVSVLEVREWFTLDVHTWSPEDSIWILQEADYEPDGHDVVEAAEATRDWQNALGMLAQNAYHHTAETETHGQLERLIDVVDELEHQYPDHMEFSDCSAPGHR
jgi:hypothetical protein